MLTAIVLDSFDHTLTQFRLGEYGYLFKLPHSLTLQMDQISLFVLTVAFKVQFSIFEGLEDIADLSDLTILELIKANWPRSVQKNLGIFQKVN